MKPKGVLKWRWNPKKKQKEAYAIGMLYETSEAKQYKKEFIKHIKEQVKQQNWTRPIDKTTFFIIDSYFYFPSINMDANNYFKAMLDAITETQLIWADDNTTMERVQRVLYDNKNPRVELIIYPTDYIGIFNDEDELNSFKNTYCYNNCSRFKRNCSILRKAIEGRIGEVSKYIDIQDMKCNAFKQKKSK